MPAGKGKPEEAEFEARIAGLGKAAFLHRNEDAAAIRGRSKGAAQVNVSAQPSDYFLVWGEGAHFAEVKATGKSSFHFDNIRPAQMGAAKRATAAKPGSYLFFIKNTETLVWYKVPAEIILNSDKKSLTWAELQPYVWG